jgi:hypothetical protein
MITAQKSFQELAIRIFNKALAETIKIKMVFSSTNSINPGLLHKKSQLMYK